MPTKSPRPFTKHLLSVLVLVPLVALLGLSPATNAAEPANGTIGPSNLGVEWQGPPPPNGVASTGGPRQCDDPGAYCDFFVLSVDVAPEYWNTHNGGMTVRIDWDVAANDFDLHVSKDGKPVDHSANGAADGTGTSESVFVPNASGEYLIRVVYFTVAAEGYRGLARFSAATGTGSVFSDQRVAFEPATLVSANLFGGEAQITMERRVSYSQAGAVDPERIFVDWPFSTTLSSSLLNRSLDGGDSFRLIYDRACAFRSRPNCATGGGGDSENDVNLASGHVFFSDQEVVANEAYAVSMDHGDTFLVQSPGTNGATATDRQWLAVTDNTFGIGGAGGTIEAFLTYHIPLIGQYIHAIDETGAIVPQPVPQVSTVGQSGQPRVDNNADSPGHQWIYQPYINALGGTAVATAFGPDYADPGAWASTLVTPDDPSIFPWIAIDDAGNAYLVWDSRGNVYYSVSPIDDKANNPDLGGRPGTFWTPAMEVSLPEVGSVVFPEVIAGAEGRIGITYVGTTQYTGRSDNAPKTTIWQTYGATIENALRRDGPPVVSTGLVSHRPVHRGNICTSGAGCGGNDDRSLLDMIDLGYDQSGRIGVVFEDNYTSMLDNFSGEDGFPFVHFAKLRVGPSLTEDRLIRLREPGRTSEGGTLRADRRGDARWPNVETVPPPNLPALDTLGAHMLIDANGDVEGHIRLSDTSKAGMLRDLAAFNAAAGAEVPAERLQYILRFSTEREVYHLSMEVRADGTIRFFGGMLDGNDSMRTGPGVGSELGARYSRDHGFHVTGHITPDEIRFHIPAADLGFGAGTPVYSVTAFCTAGPLDQNEFVQSPKRTVDASPPFDAVLSR